MPKLIYILFLTLLVACGKNKPNIVGTWDVCHYEAKGTRVIKDPKLGEWIFEFTDDGKLTTNPNDSLNNHTVEYTVKNNKELRLDDQGVQITYIIKTITSAELVLENENEVISLKRSR